MTCGLVCCLRAIDLVPLLDDGFTGCNDLIVSDERCWDFRFRLRWIQTRRVDDVDWIQSDEECANEAYFCMSEHPQSQWKKTTTYSTLCDFKGRYLPFVTLNRILFKVSEAFVAYRHPANCIVRFEYRSRNIRFNIA